MIEKEVRVVMKVEQVEQVGWVTEATEAATTEAKKRSGAAVDAATAAAAAAALAAAEEDVDARAMRGGAAPTQRLTPLSGSSHHGEPLTAERLAGCSRLYIRQRRGGARRASLHSSVVQRVGERLLRRPLRATSRGEG